MKRTQRLAVVTLILFVTMAVTTLGSDLPHAGWFVVVAGIVLVAVVLTVEKLKGMTS